MGKKCTKVEKKARVEELAEMIVKGYSQRELRMHVRHQWGLSDDSALIYIREARTLVTADLKDLDRQDMLAAKIQQLEAIARDSIASGRENNAIGAIRLLSELVGLGVNLKK